MKERPLLKETYERETPFERDCCAHEERDVTYERETPFERDL